MRIAIVGAQDAPHELACTHWSGIKKSLKQMDVEWNIFCCRSELDFEQHIIDYKPDVVIYGLIDMAINQEARDKIRKGLSKAKIVLWYTDCRTPETGQIYCDLDGTVDLFVVSNDGQKEFHKEHFNMIPQYVPQAVYPTDKPVFAQSVIDEYGDFIFIGGKINREGFETRMHLVTEIEERLGLNVINGVTPDQRAMIYKAMPKLYGSAKFTLDISHFWDIEKYTSNRFWVIPGFWGFPLTKRFPGHDELYPETVRVYWDTVDELEEKVNYYRAHEDERVEMVRKGWQWTKDHHTYRHRIERILELLK
jgi:hypothetical protein